MAQRAAWFAQNAQRLEEEAVLETPRGVPYPCPCCGYLTLEERGIYDICPVCFWEDDGQDDPHADEVWGGPNGSLSLTQARANFAEFGASDRRRLEFVRPPAEDEMPPAAPRP